jgi:hypothetical protein
VNSMKEKVQPVLWPYKGNSDLAWGLRFSWGCVVCIGVGVGDAEILASWGSWRGTRILGCFSSDPSFM